MIKPCGLVCVAWSARQRCPRASPQPFPLSAARAALCQLALRRLAPLLFRPLLPLHAHLFLLQLQHLRHGLMLLPPLLRLLRRRGGAQRARFLLAAVLEIKSASPIAASATPRVVLKISTAAADSSAWQ